MNVPGSCLFSKVVYRVPFHDSNIAVHISLPAPHHCQSYHKYLKESNNNNNNNPLRSININ